MITWNILLIANIICAIGTLFQINKVIKNRALLKGYDILGSILTCLSVVMFQIVFLYLEQYLSFSLGMITVIYWLLVTIYTIIIKVKGEK